MKHAALALPICCALLSISAASCGMSRADIERQTVSQFQRRLDTDADLKAYHLKAAGASLVKSGPRTYSGFVSVILNGKTRDIGVTVTVDRGNIMFETKPSAFAFLAEKAPVQAFGPFHGADIRNCRL
ncbi:MAG: hypothetical protein LBD08_02225 [Treponema sp.]|jgi:hypothetical protein|nr:hypothetical protein [Treponema sp.]